MRAALVFDADCGFCRWALAKVLAWDRRAAIRPVPLQNEEADRLLARLDPGARMASWHLVTPDGRVRSGGDAVAPLARLLPWGAPIAGLAELLPGPTRALYGAVARNRHRLGRALGRQACEVRPQDRPDTNVSA